MKIAVVVAHADDEALGMGATIALLSPVNEVHLLVLGDGVSSRGLVPWGDKKRQAAAARQDHCRAAAEVLGIRTVEFRSFPDQRFDEGGLLNITQQVEGWLQDTKPEVLYTHSLVDLNLDHRITCQAVLTATRPVPGQTVREVLSFEVPSATEWGFGSFGSFCPNVWVPVTPDQMAAKQKALACYAGEMRGFPHPRSLETIEARAIWWGSVVGCDLAEAFCLVRGIRAQ